MIEAAIEEDAAARDITTAVLFGGTRPSEDSGGAGSEAEVEAACIARRPGVICGLPLAALVLERFDTKLQIRSTLNDGDRVGPGGVAFEVSGPIATLLSVERVLLNFVQRLSGIATATRAWVDALEGLPVRLLDTRKTTPGWRHLEKYAVRAGGGTNHRLGLADGILVKDNHIWALRALGRGDPHVWVAELRRRNPQTFLEVEVETRQDFLSVLQLGVDAILLDNFPLDDLRWAVQQCRALAAPRPRPLLEASGGLRVETASAVAATGVDRISVGAITHSAPALDLSLEFRGLWRL